MVDDQHWLDRWRDNRIGFHEGEVNRHLRRYLADFSLTPGSRIFVPLCGKAVDMAWLARQGFEVLGVELSALAIEAFFDEQGIAYEVAERGDFREYRAERLCLLQGDFFDLRAADLDRCALVYDRAALIAMADRDRPRYSSHMLAIAAAVERMLLITFCYRQAEMEGPPFAVCDDEVERAYGAAFRLQRLAREDILDESPRWRANGLTALAESVFRLER